MTNSNELNTNEINSTFATTARDPKLWIVKSVMIAKRPQLLQNLLFQMNRPFEFILGLVSAPYALLQEIGESLEQDEIDVEMIENSITNSSLHPETAKTDEFFIEANWRRPEGTVLTIGFKRDRQKNVRSDWIFHLLESDPEPKIAEGLRRLKALLEVGEVATIYGQSVGAAGQKAAEAEETKRSA